MTTEAIQCFPRHLDAVWADPTVRATAALEPSMRRPPLALWLLHSLHAVFRRSAGRRWSRIAQVIASDGCLLIAMHYVFH